MDRSSDPKRMLKELIKKLHQGARPEQVKEEFAEALKDVTPTEIARVEEELIKEGMAPDEIHRLCEVHIAAFRESLEKEKTVAPEGHPVRILTQEHRIILELAAELKGLSEKIKRAKDFDSVGAEMQKLKEFEKELKDSESHYLREENVLFPYLEKHGVTQPPAMMWMEHDKIREIKKRLYGVVDSRDSASFRDFAKQLEQTVISLAEMLTSHFYKENDILFPTGLKVIAESEWRQIRQQFDELGYCCFTPQPPPMSVEAAKAVSPTPETEGPVAFETGSMSKEEVEAIFSSLPVDLTFVDKEDTVRFFSQTKERIFPRTKAVIGRKVQQCHPRKSLHVVNQILQDFNDGRREVAEFWINLNQRLIYIRYFPVRNKNGEYLGCVEVTQDITDIKKIEGEKRLL